MRSTGHWVLEGSPCLSQLQHLTLREIDLVRGYTILRSLPSHLVNPISLDLNITTGQNIILLVEPPYLPIACSNLRSVRVSTLLPNLALSVLKMLPEPRDGIVV
jgi:hypothetical protein